MRNTSFKGSHVLVDILPKPWQGLLLPLCKSNQFSELDQFLALEYNQHTVYPPKAEIFSALSFFRPSQTKVVILGQDPYHGENQAHGLSFSVPKDLKKLPPSLKNIRKEIEETMSVTLPTHGNLEQWAEQGVLLLNAVLTVRAGQAASHQKKGWESFTDAIIKGLSDNHESIVFILWGSYAHKKEVLIDQKKHLILKSVHPSPLSAHRGFFGSDHFNKANKYLISQGKETIEWNTL